MSPPVQRRKVRSPCSPSPRKRAAIFPLYCDIPFRAAMIRSSSRTSFEVGCCQPSSAGRRHSNRIFTSTTYSPFKGWSMHFGSGTTSCTRQASPRCLPAWLLLPLRVDLSLGRFGPLSDNKRLVSRQHHVHYFITSRNLSCGLAYLRGLFRGFQPRIQAGQLFF